MEIINITKYLDKNDYTDILNTLNDKDKFYDFIKLVLEQFNNLNSKKIEFIIKIILNKVIYFDGNIHSENLQIFYKKIEDDKGFNLNILNKFISTYDKLKQLKIIFIALNFQIINLFKKKFKEFEMFTKNQILTMEDLENIKELVENKVIVYYNAFFETSYNNIFFKRITDCKNVITQEVNTDEIIDRLISLKKLFTLPFLEKLGVESITIQDFLDMEYNKRVTYYRTFYIKTFSLFKNYFKLFDTIGSIKSDIDDLIKIDPLNYIDSLYDSSSSFIFSEDNLEIEMSKFEDKEKISIFSFENSYEEIEYENSSSEDDHADTPFISMADMAPFVIDEEESNGQSNSSSESYGSSESPSDEDNEISDIFVKKED
jgi:hypothetical protein